MYKTIILLFIFINQFSGLLAQEHESENDQEHEHQHEIGASIGPAYFINDDEFGLSTHIHYVYNLTNSKFGLGSGYEHIFAEIKHSFVGAEFNYRPIHQLTLNLSPGIVFEGNQNVSRDFGLHFETSYEFEIGAFHIGPVAELAWHSNDYHVSFGAHFGLGF